MSEQSLLIDLLDRNVRDARGVFLVNGKRLAWGGGSGEDIAIRVQNPRFFSRVLASGNLGLGEAYMNLEFEMDSGRLEDFLLILLRNRLDRRLKISPAAALRVAWLRFLGMIRGKAANVQKHYDAGDDLFQAFLDSNLVYSCGYVNEESDDVEQLQFNKMDRICRKLRLKRGDSLLDVGCGYGGLLIHAARHYGASGRGITSSRRHAEHAAERMKREGVKGQVEIQYGDFNDIAGQYDKVVSVGMMEHVPRREYRRYFRKIARVLKPGGRALLHTVGANAPKNRHDPFIQKYIFPNSNQPRLSEIALELERNGLVILDVENMIRHYGYTMREWHRRFLKNRASLNGRYDDRFRRMWEYYLACGIAAAFASDGALYQVLFMNDQTSFIPLHRV